MIHVELVKWLPSLSSPCSWSATPPGKIAVTKAPDSVVPLTVLPPTIFIPIPLPALKEKKDEIDNTFVHQMLCFLVYRRLL